MTVTKQNVKMEYLFSVITTVIFLCMGIWFCKPLVITINGKWSRNKVLITKLLILSTVEFVGARKVVCGFVNMFVWAFSGVISSFENDTNAFWFSLWICLFVGNPIWNEVKNEYWLYNERIERFWKSSKSMKMLSIGMDENNINHYLKTCRRNWKL